MCREKSEIEAFVKDAVAAGEDCLGRCLYISGVPGTGKVSDEGFILNSIICFSYTVKPKDTVSHIRSMEANNRRYPVHDARLRQFWRL